jgi:5-methylcytosine-specific restriction endonuclease McrA
MDLRQQVTERANRSCEYCRSQARYATQPFSVEHIIPRAKGGPTILENLALACQGCNNHKYDKVEAPDLVSGEIVPLYHPRRDRWNAHFAWSDDSR